MSSDCYKLYLFFINGFFYILVIVIILGGGLVGRKIRTRVRVVAGSPRLFYRCGSEPPGRHTQHMPTTPSLHRSNPVRLCRWCLTSLRSCRHSSTARLLAQVCFGQRRVRSSRQASSSDSFQPVALRDCEAPAAAATAGASLTAGSPGLRTGTLGRSAGRLAALEPSNEPKLKKHSNVNTSSNRMRTYAAIFTPLSS